MDFLTQSSRLDPLLHNGIAPEWSGSAPTMSVTEVSGPLTVWDKLTELSLQPARPSVEATLERVKRDIVHLKRLLTDAEIYDIAVAYGAVSVDQAPPEAVLERMRRHPQSSISGPLG